jgi:hypothetical protein
MKLKQQLATIKTWTNTWINTIKPKKNTTPLAPPTTTKGAKQKKTKCEEQMN